MGVAREVSRLIGLAQLVEEDQHHRWALTGATTTIWPWIAAMRQDEGGADESSFGMEKQLLAVSLCTVVYCSNSALVHNRGGRPTWHVEEESRKFYLIILSDGSNTRVVQPAASYSRSMHVSPELVS